MIPEHIRNARCRARERMADQLRPGTLQWDGSTEVLTCSVRISVIEREDRDYAQVRIRSATVLIDKEQLPELPETRTTATITPEGSDPDTFRLFESHDQDSERWLLRLAQHGDGA
ncbi:MAG: hypothetical protein AAF236_00765 [Verrucomicrobiota bacterium]